MQGKQKLYLNPRDIKKILVVNLGGIGDVLLSTPALRSLKKLFLHSEIYFLAIPQTYEIVKDLPYIDKVFIFNLGLFDTLSNFKLLAALRKNKFDLAVNMRTLVSAASALKIKFLLSAINPKLKAGRDTEGRGDFFDIRIPECLPGDKYEMEYDLETVKALGCDITDRRIDFNIDKTSSGKIRALLEKKGVNDTDNLIGIHPGGNPSHRWPIGNYLEAVNEISRRAPSKFVITGGRGDLDLERGLLNKADKNVISFIGKLNICDSSALIKRCGLFITNDTGPMHIAAILGVPQVAIFGPGYLSRFDPRNISKKAVVLHNRFVCAPCNKKICRSMGCLKSISPREVIEAALKSLRENAVPCVSEREKYRHTQRQASVPLKQ